MEPSLQAGRLLLVGGRSDRAWEHEEILGELVRLAGGPASARIVLATISVREDRARDEASRVALARLGVADVRTLELEGPEDVGRAQVVGIVERASAVVFDGDDPEGLARLLRDSKLDATIRRRLADSLLVAGLGPVGGALVAKMLVDDVPDPDHGPDPSLTEPITGLGYLAGVILDPFFGRDGRPDRLISALPESPGDLGIGIDDATAVLVDRGTLTVIGRGTATVVDTSTGAASPIRHTIRPSDRFDLATRALAGPPGG